MKKVLKFFNAKGNSDYDRAKGDANNQGMVSLELAAE